MSANKTLTVSYGTFSCTLEGFEDAFATMKLITEHFRKLAEQDPAFGTAPMEPDLKTLIALASTGVTGEVKAEIGPNNQVNLRAPSADPQEANPQETAQLHDIDPDAAQDLDNVEETATDDISEGEASPGLSQEPEDQAQDSEVDIQEDLSIDDSNPEIIDHAEAPEKDPAPEGTSVSEKLSRIRAVVARNAQALPILSFSDDQHSAALLPEYEADQNGASETDLTTVLENYYNQDTVADAAPVVAEDDDFEEEYEDEVIEIPSGADQTELHSEKSSDSEAVTETSVTVTESQADKIDGNQAHQVASVEDVNIVADQSMQSPETPTQTDPVSPENAMHETSEDGEDVPEPSADKVPPFILTDNVVTSPEHVEPETIDQQTADTLKSLVAEINTSDDEDHPTEENAPSMETSEVTDFSNTTDDDLEIEETPQSNETSERFPVPTEDNFDEATLAPTPNQEAVTAHSEETKLSKEDEADLQHELSTLMGIEAPKEEPTPEESTQAKDDDAGSAGDIARNHLSEQKRSEGREASVSRLLEETNTQLDNPDSQNRRSAISHLRAAVAATVADRRIHRIRRYKKQDEYIEVYRADLASVVKPNQGGARRVKPSDDNNRNELRPSPLVLVSEQRVETPTSNEAPAEDQQLAASQAQPVTPRRIQNSSVALDMNDQELPEEEETSLVRPWENFRAFAQDKGAESYGDYLQAAAAWITWIDGEPQFTRPAVMQMVAECIGEGEFSRKDGLHAFGGLVQSQVIIKVSRGLFSISEETPFHP